MSDGICIYLSEEKLVQFIKTDLSSALHTPGGVRILLQNVHGNKTKAECPGLTADDAIIIDGNTIKIHVLADRQSTKGFRQMVNLSLTMVINLFD